MKEFDLIDQIVSILGEQASARVRVAQGTIAVSLLFLQIARWFLQSIVSTAEFTFRIGSA